MPRAQIKDEKQLSEVLASITNDPAILVDDQKSRPLAQALMIEGVKHLQARSYDQALANFLEAYAKFPSPKILLNIASTLRDWQRAEKSRSASSIGVPSRTCFTRMSASWLIGGSKWVAMVANASSRFCVTRMVLAIDCSVESSCSSSAFLRCTRSR